MQKRPSRETGEALQAQDGAVVAEPGAPIASRTVSSAGPRLALAP
jgi:hypothetical protein